jgi:hypothetical protein
LWERSDPASTALAVMLRATAASSTRPPSRTPSNLRVYATEIAELLTRSVGGSVNWTMPSLSLEGDPR